MRLIPFPYLFRLFSYEVRSNQALRRLRGWCAGGKVPLPDGSGKVADIVGTGKGAELNPELLIKPGSRLKQLIDWLAKDPYGPLLVFDECHKVGHTAVQLEPPGSGRAWFQRLRLNI